MSKGTYALVTGASSGIGLEFAKILAEKGHDLIVVARSNDALETLADFIRKEYKREVLVVCADLSLPGSGKKLFTEIQSKGIEPEILINNAGFGDYGFFHESKLDKQIQMIDLNVRSLTELTHLFGSKMVERRKGKIVHLSSIAAFQPGPLMSVYYASKHYVQAFSVAIANEWKEYGVTVCSLCPGPTESGFQQTASIEESPFVKGKKLPTSREVALYGYDAMIKGKVIAVHGMKNRILSALSSITPSVFSAAVARKLQEYRKHAD
jgi:short-subunit dehydrogenase